MYIFGILSFLLAVGLGAYTWYKTSTMYDDVKPGKWQGPTSGEGVPVPVLFGTRQITNPHVMWYGDLKSVKRDDGVFGYYAGMQFGLCHGKLDKIRDIYYADRSVGTYFPQCTYDRTVMFAVDFPTTELAGIESGEQLNWTLDVKMGEVNIADTVDSGINDYAAQQMGLALGPKYYGIASVTAHQIYVGTSPYIKPCSFVCQRIHTKDGGRNTQWYDSKAEISSGRGREDEWKYQILQNGAVESVYSDPNYDDSAWPTGHGGVGNAIWGSVVKDYGEDGQYPVPRVMTQLPINGITVKYGCVQKGCQLWLRWDLGALPQVDFAVQCWHDDAGKLWLNGTNIPLIQTSIASQSEYGHFNSTAVLPAALIVPGGPNIIAYAVKDSYDWSTPPKPIGNNTYIYAGLQIGLDGSEPQHLVDMNPVHIIRECLTDAIWGMGYPDADIGTSFTDAADTCYTERLGMSLLWDQQSSIEDFVNEILRHISAVLYIDRTSGLIEIKLIRQDYTVGNLLVLDESDVARVEDVNIRAAGELVNQVTVAFSQTLRGDQGSITLYEQGLIEIQGGIVDQRIDYPCITNVINASKLALRDLKVLSGPVRSATVTASRKAAGLQPGVPFVLNYPTLEFVNAVMRAEAVDIGDGVDDDVKLTCVDDVFALPSAAPTGATGPIAQPPPQPPTVITESDAYYTGRILDVRNKGSVECVYLTQYFEASGWTEMADGSLEWDLNEVTEGQPVWSMPVWHYGFDGVEPDVYAEGGSWMLGQRVLIPAEGSPADRTKRLSGVWVIETLGGYWANYGTPEQEWIWENARMHRDPSFSQSGDFTDGMIFHVRNGDTYAGDFFQLDTYPIELGVTTMTWTDVGSTITWADTLNLMRAEEIAVNNTSKDGLLMLSGTVTNDTIDLEDSLGNSNLDTLATSPNVRAIPAGTWRVFPSLVSVTGASAGSTTVIGARFSRVAYGQTKVLFEMLSAELEMTDGAYYDVPQPLHYAAPEIPMNTYNPQGGDGLRMALTVHTDSASEITVAAEYNAINAIRVQIPKGKGNPLVSAGSSDEDFISVPIGDGFIDPGITAGTVYVTGCSLGGSHLQGMLRPALAAGKTRQKKVIFDGPLNIDNDASTTGHEAYAALTISTSGQSMSDAQSALTFAWNPVTERWTAVSSWSTAT
jgi:hypothetical protein